MDLMTVPAEFNYDEYLSELKALFADNEARYYLDTSFLSQMYKLNSSIRKDFYEWGKEKGENIKLPY